MHKPRFPMTIRQKYLHIYCKWYDTSYVLWNQSPYSFLVCSLHRSRLDIRHDISTDELGNTEKHKKKNLKGKHHRGHGLIQFACNISRGFVLWKTADFTGQLRMSRCARVLTCLILLPIPRVPGPHQFTGILRIGMDLGKHFLTVKEERNYLNQSKLVTID